VWWLADTDEAATSVVVSDEPEKVSAEWWAEYVKAEDQFNTELSGKLLILADILKMCESIGDKVWVDWRWSAIVVVYVIDIEYVFEVILYFWLLWSHLHVIVIIVVIFISEQKILCSEQSFLN